MFFDSLYEKRKVSMVIGIVLLVLLLILGGVWLWLNTKASVAASRLRVTGEGTRFPVVSGSNLQREEFEFPRDFAGSLNLVIIPFQMQQQEDVNTWIPFAQKLERSFPGVVYYELPTIRELPALSRSFINEGMRAGIPDRTARQRTVTLYIDKGMFKEALDIEKEETIHLFLVDGQGQILWREQGVYSEDKTRDLIPIVEKKLE